MGTYHSFPRRVPEGRDYDDFCLDILASIIDIGLVLVPEFIKFDERFEDGTITTLTMGQKRICFSDIEPKQLYEHSNFFGRFAIQWSQTTALEMGAMPVFYYPEMVIGAPGLTNLTATLICRLAETKNLLETLNDILAITRSNNLPLVLNIENKGEQIVVDHTNTRLLVEFLNNNYRGFSTLSTSLRALSQLFCPTHNSSYTDPLAYYRQREWRIISDILITEIPTFRELTLEEKGKISSVNPIFFEREIETFTGNQKRIDECRLYVDPSGKHPLERAEAIIVPETAVSRVEIMLSEKCFSLPVVAMENPIYGYEK